MYKFGAKTSTTKPKTIATNAKPTKETPSEEYIEYEKNIDARIEAGEDVQKQAWVQPSGYEPPYEPDKLTDRVTYLDLLFFKWPIVNDKSYEFGTSCYGNAICEYRKSDHIVTNMGFLSGKEDDYFEIDYNEGNMEEATKQLFELMKSDIEANGGSIRPIGKNEQCAEGGYKIFMAIMPFTKNPYTGKTLADVHFYRQNPDGVWSHKQGQGVVNCYDASGQIIYDPEYCDRDYTDEENQNIDNYSYPAGFYEIVP